MKLSERLRQNIWDMEESQRAQRREAAALLEECERALINVTAHMIAAVSLLENGGKKAAPSDKMFEQMLIDYKESIESGRATLARLRAQEKADEAK